MAQTIAIRAGSTGHAWSNTNTSTLFTQSGGTATRVIINQLQFTNDAGGSPQGVGIFLESAGTGQMHMIGGVRFIYQSMQVFQAWAGGSQEARTSYGNSGTGPFGVPSGHMLRGSSNVSIGAIQPSTLTVATSYNSDEFVFFPNSFYMANGDSVKLRGYWNGGTGACYWSFTTITES